MKNWSDLVTKPWAVATGLVAATSVAVLAFGWKVMWIILGLAVGLLVIWLIRRIRERRQAAQFRAGLNQNASKAPSSVNDPKQRAELDRLREKFSQGLHRVLEEGRRKRVDFLYRHPWILVVGEPGSGKTEAIRHSGIVSPRMQDELQGVGGTLNMDWWFTERAVILDTAGRMVFEEESASSNNEFQEFLRMLRKGRPLTPINGLLVTVSADTLVGGTDEQIRERSEKLAEKIAQIQSVLEVRFPVYVVVTKCDKITGFREFFEGLDEPSSLNQILGWSNPEGLDVSFKAEDVETHLREVIETLRLIRYRLIDRPGNTAEGKRRIDEVDSLYAFPHGLKMLAPRLRMYLEPVFAAGEWSASAPLFVRGIYFSSALCQGAVLDQELASALGVSVDKLSDEGKVFRRDRALFLRDLFVEKMLPERGLVTASHRTEGIVLRRRLVTWSAFGAVVVVGLGLIFWADRTFDAGVNRELGLWRAKLTNPDKPEDGQMLSAPLFERRGEWTYVGDKETLTVNDEPVARIEYQRELEKLTRSRLRLPWLFRFAGAFRGDFDQKRRRAQQAVLVSDVVTPLVGSARFRIDGDSAWTTQHTQVLSLLVQAEKAVQDKQPMSASPEFFARTLWQFGMRSNTSNVAVEELFKTSYQPVVGESPTWPPAPVADDGVTVRAGIAKLVRNHDDGMKKIELAIDDLGRLRTALAELRRFESQLGSGGGSVAEVVRNYTTRAAQVDQLIEKSRADGVFREQVGLMSDAITVIVDEFEKSLDESVRQFGETGGSPPRAGAQPDVFAEIGEQFGRQRERAKKLVSDAFPEKVRQEMRELDQRFLARDSAGSPLYTARVQLLKKIVGTAERSGPGSEFRLIGHLAELDQLIVGAAAERKPAVSTGPGEVKPVALPPPRPDAFQSGVRELLVQLYEQEYEQFLDEQVGFPLVRDRAGKIVRGEDLAALREQLRGLAADLPALDAIVQGDRNSRPALLKARLAAAVPRIESILSALMDAEGQVARVRITYPGARDQQEAVSKAVNNLLAGAAFSVWRYVGSSLREPTWLADEEKEIGSFPVVSRDLELYFYRTADSSTPDGEPLRPLENWQLFTRLLEGTQEPKRRDDGLQWRVLYSRKDEQGRDRFFALTVLFPRPLPPLDRWPTFGQLKRR